MTKSNDSWSRCAKEFTSSPLLINNKTPLNRESDDSIMRPVHVKRLNFNNGLSSCRGLVATDVALASLEQIETNDLVSRWIADGFCTPPASELNTSCPSTPVLGNIGKNEGESFPGLIEDLQKSPVIKCRGTFGKESRFQSRNGAFESLEKSPIIGKPRRSLCNKETRFGACDKRKLNESGSLSSSDKSPILGKARNSTGKERPRIKRKRLQDLIDFDNDSLARSVVKEAKIKVEAKLDGADLSQDLFDEESIAASPKTGSNITQKIQEDTDFFCFNEKRYETLKDRGGNVESGVLEQASRLSPSSSINYDRYSSSPVIKLDTKAKRSLHWLIKPDEKSLDSFIQDSEEFPALRNQSKLEDKFLILDSEFSIEKRKFVTDTERIDCDTSSENEAGEDSADAKKERIITGVESESDKTVSDLIEEPTTQVYSEPPKSAAVITPQIAAASFSSRNSMPLNSPRISDTISPNEQNSPRLSIVDISVETTPPRTQGEEYPALAPDLDSGKKKKSRPKKGSLAARLQKLISGQISCVRLWRHQMSRESGFERSSAPCTTLLVIERWNEFGKDLYESKVLDDPYNLLNGSSDASRKDDESRNLVVMTNPDFVGSVKLPPGTVFKIYLPWEIFDRKTARGEAILHALYFNVVSNPGDVKLEPDANESQTFRRRNELMGCEVTREFHCPCLQNGKIDDSCFAKFTNHKIDVIDEIVK